jgi:hypothetical protein
VGDDENRPQKAIPAAVKAMIVDTVGGCVQVSWDPESVAPLWSVGVLCRVSGSQRLV